MKDVDENALKDLFKWENRDIPLRIRFNNSEEFEMTVSGWAQDIGESPHVHGTVICPLKSRHSWKEGDAIMFQLRDVEAVENLLSGKVIFRTTSE